MLEAFIVKAFGDTHASAVYHNCGFSTYTDSPSYVPWMSFQAAASLKYNSFSAISPENLSVKFPPEFHSIDNNSPFFLQGSVILNGDLPLGIARA